MSYFSPLLPHLPLPFHPHQAHSWAPPPPSSLATPSTPPSGQQQQQLQQQLQQQQMYQHSQLQQQQLNDLTRRVAFPLSFPNHIDGPPSTPLFPLSHHYPTFVNHFHHLYSEPCCGISPFHHFGMPSSTSATSPCHQSDLFDYCKERSPHFNLNVNLKSSNGVGNSVISKNVLTNNNCDIKVGSTTSSPILSKSSSPIKSNHSLSRDNASETPIKKKVKVEDCSISNNHCTRDYKGVLNNNCSNLNSKIICKTDEDKCKKSDASVVISQSVETKFTPSSGDVICAQKQQLKQQQKQHLYQLQQQQQHQQSQQQQLQKHQQNQQNHQQHQPQPQQIQQQQQQQHQQRQSVIIRKDVKSEEKQSGNNDKKQTMHIELISSPQAEVNGSSAKSLTTLVKSTSSSKSEPFYPCSKSSATPTSTASTTCHQSEMFAYWKERRKKNANPNSNLYINLKTPNGVNGNSVITKNVILSDKCDSKVGSSTPATFLTSSTTSVPITKSTTITTPVTTSNIKQSASNLIETPVRKKVKTEESSLIANQFNVSCSISSSDSSSSNNNKLICSIADEKSKKLDSSVVISSKSVDSKLPAGCGEVLNCTKKQQQKHHQQQSVIIRKDGKAEEKQSGNVDKKQTMHIELVSSAQGETVNGSSAKSLLTLGKTSSIKKTKDLESTSLTGQNTVEPATTVTPVTVETSSPSETLPLAKQSTSNKSIAPLKSTSTTPTTPSSQRVRRRRFRSGLDMIRNAKSRKKAKQSNQSANVSNNSAVKSPNPNGAMFRLNGKMKDNEFIKRNNKVTFDDGSPLASTTSTSGSMRNSCGGSLSSSSLSSTSVPIEIKRIIVNKALGETILHRAARQGYTHIVRYCLATNTCDINARDNAGYTPLHECCSRGHLEIARALLEHGADIDSSATGGVRPFHDAVESDHIEIVRLLLSYGSDPTIATYTGSTPLKLARSSRMIQFLRGFIYDLTGEIPPHPEPEKSDRPVFPWKFTGSSRLLDLKESGFDVFDEESVPCEDENDDLNDLLLEISDTPHLPTYRIKSGSAVSIVRSACPPKSTKKSSSSINTTNNSKSNFNVTNGTTNNNNSKNNNLYTQNYLKLCDILKQMGLSKDQFFNKYVNIEILCLSTANLISNALTSCKSHHPSVEDTTQLSELVSLDDSIREILGIETLRVP
ncbi:putative mediator of RNA polymerase II transcription subunit 26 [Tetranychus urticae]|uniref:putative mediator of RNA polymerase II transcription subunit 26 n=1 Tax=Tetranychus urticae TaxID=32264 RepID=UPI00077B95C0|nr:putative mediator of RNA polymerase II transcription subunit 26 [Tetranychus urticae]XP_025018014.1 putative mediator of RNA polymerase II transcription subunit 26 [Tetranychus urticae]XP_025018015.1 putative mediator of RNA polymerase II transcription subunit 26 [Tetranychus urticae]XP_025018016.1 putative mediator of RNA polymerase II transcription subunit 26 [Tetranychus urticae]XP_025018017.1 putative mediator of RNA polymerase II transcription subunit 26 [Tetranychus urticae]XP_0250180